MVCISSALCQGSVINRQGLTITVRVIKTSNMLTNVRTQCIEILRKVGFIASSEKNMLNTGICIKHKTSVQKIQRNNKHKLHRNLKTTVKNKKI